MAHMMKHTKASCGHMFAHFDRAAEHINNENLDKTKTYLNYNLACHQQIDQGEFVRKRCAEVHCQNRKDVNVMVSWVVTAPKDLPESEHKEFFKSSYDFLKIRYGEENVISAYVHMDEVQPHMHFAFVPICYDKKKNRYKVSAKEVVNRQDLKTFHTDLQIYLENELGHSVGILNEATKDGNKSIEELKRQSATERLREVEQEASLTVKNAEISLLNAQRAIDTLRTEYEAKKAYIDACSINSNINYLYPSYAEKKKSLFGKETVTVPRDKWEERFLSFAEKDAIKKAYDVFEKAIKDFQKNQKEIPKDIKRIFNDNKELSNSNIIIADELSEAKIELKIIKSVIKKSISLMAELYPENIDLINDFVEILNNNGELPIPEPPASPEPQPKYQPRRKKQIDFER